MPFRDSMQPSAWVRRFAPLIAREGRVLDLACGSGRHALLLADMGLHVVALDRNAAVLAHLRESIGSGQVELKLADVEGGPWPYGGDEFDGVIVTNYLHRPLFPRIAACLRPGGVLIYETFARGNERHGRPSNPDFLLARDELLMAFGAPLAVVAFEQGTLAVPKAAVVQRICAVRATDWSRVPLPAGK